MTLEDPAAYLRTLPAVRERTRLVYAQAERGALTNFDLDPTKLDAVVSYVSAIIERDFAPDYSKIPPHGRWGNFDAGGYPRIQGLLDEWAASGVPEEEVVRRLVDLFLISVLLDAGAGNKWVYTEASTNFSIGRSEGTAVASYYLFKSGLLSSDPTNPYQADAAALKDLDVAKVLEQIQHSEANPIDGPTGRVELLRSLGHALEASPQFFGSIGRPGNMFDYLIQNSTPTPDGKHQVSLPTIWEVLMTGLNPIWPKGRTVINGVPIGDAWPCSSMPQDGEEWEKIVPFHKLSQWLCYSILVPLERHGNIVFTEKEMQTGLPEYRNGGLLVDLGLLKLKPAVVEKGLSNYAALGAVKEDEVPIFLPDDDVIVEWRAMTVCILDKLLPLVNEKLGIAGTKDELILAQLLEAGTWKGGREVAAKLRPESRGPPIAIKSDGTLF
ncbi:hypothetical protein BZA70DRAFT_276336 [Myxozyma melibiosi]|uniref:DUF1688-domain-containing protein n=1 Tax=Myxozyma melibiosi TaxID=54550 RepID=A0ABR1F915_9ASCO